MTEASSRGRRAAALAAIVVGGLSAGPLACSGEDVEPVRVADGGGAASAALDSPRAAQLVVDTQARFVLADEGIAALGASDATAFRDDGARLVPVLGERASARRTATVALPKRSVEPMSIRDDDSGATIDVVLEDADDVGAETADGFAVYPAALASRVAGGDVIHRVRADGVEDYVTIERAPARAELAYRVTLGEGVAGLRLVENTLELVDESNAPRLRMNPPWLAGAGGLRHDARIEVDGCAVDADPAAPWDRPVTPPGARTCRVTVRWSAGVEYPALLDPAWTTVYNATPRRAYQAAARVGTTGQVLVAGGRTGSGGITNAYLYDSATKTTAVTAAMPAGRWWHAAASAGASAVHVCGGCSDATTASNACYQYSGGAWSTLASMATARANFTLIGNGAPRYAIGGQSSCGASPSYLSSAERYEGTTWTALPAMNTTRAGHEARVLRGATVAFPREILIAGGRNTSALNSARILRQTASASWEWVNAPNMSAAREQIAMAAYPSTVTGENRIFVYGSGSAETYERGASAWAAHPGPPSTIQFPRAGSLFSSGVFQGILVTGDDGECCTEPACTKWGGMRAAVFRPSTNGWLTATAPGECHRFGAYAEIGGTLVIDGGQSMSIAKTLMEVFELQPGGSPCSLSAPGSCLSSLCPGGYCCSASCTGSGKTCTSTGACTCASGFSSCGTLTSSNNCCHDTTQYCSVTAAPGTCSPKKPPGEACSSSVQCESNLCLGGYCCSGACSGTGKVCNTTGACVCDSSYQTCGTDCCDPAAQYCAGTSCAAKKAGGATCSAAVECSSGVCLGGRCCSGACSGAGKTCSSTGACVCVSDPAHAACGALTSTSNCCNTSTQYCADPTTSSCSAKKGAGVACSGDGECTSGQCLGGFCCSAACSGSGKTCASGSGACQCASGHTACGTVTQTSNCCSSSQYCSDPTAHTCSAKKAAGASCGSGLECGSGLCLGGFCCSGACSGNGKSCASGSGACQCAAGYDACGTLTPTSNCCNDGNQYCADPTTSTCAGAQSAGTACSSGIQCASGACLGGFCCASGCTGAGKACAFGTGVCQCEQGYIACGPLTTTSNCCSGAQYCSDPANSTCANPLADGSACTSSAQCASGHCVDGYCCNDACTGLCRACSAAKKGAGSNGVCGNVSGGADPDNECADEGAASCKQNGVCNGAGACQLYATGTQCKSPACAGGSQTTSACDGIGNCVDTPQACSPYQCDTTGLCLSACTSNGHCAPTHYCSAATCVPKKANGETCTGGDGSQCASGNCVDGACCDLPCTGSCQACSAAKKGSGADGSCGPIAAGTDPDSECADQGAASCNQDGQCDGAGACRTYASGTTCLPTACQNGVVETSTCAGVGNCNTVASSCGGYACNASGTACLGSCVNDAGCIGSGAVPHYCAGGSCEVKKELGDTCAGANQCKSGFCADGMCCNAACTSTCQACAAALKQGGVDGECGPAKDGLDPHDDCAATPATGCGTDGNCDGTGKCRLHPIGVSCGASSCDGNNVKGKICSGDGVCIDSTAAGQSCAPYLCQSGSCATSCQTDNECLGDTWCNAGLCDPKRLPGEVCTAAKMCKSGFCVDGVCCDTECTGQCEACDLGGSEGSCGPVPAGGVPHGNRPKCDAVDGACSGACNGAFTAKCVFPGAETTCGGTKCEGSVYTPYQCDGEGVCKAGAPQDCGAYACDTVSALCRSSCTVNSHCAPGAECNLALGQCGIVGASCKDAFTVVAPGGTETSCAPYKCTAGICRTDCDTDNDCQSSHHCSDKKCVATSGSGGSGGGAAGSGATPGGGKVESDSGCGCRTAGSHGPARAAWPFALMAMGLLLRRRRARRLEEARS